VPQPNAVPQPDVFPDSVAGQEPDPVSEEDAYPVSRRERHSDSGGQPNSNADGDSLPLAGQLPEQAVAVGFDDVRERHRHLPVRRAVGADPHLDDVGETQVRDACAIL
jgi:hypothetical protein